MIRATGLELEISAVTINLFLVEFSTCYKNGVGNVEMKDFYVEPVGMFISDVMLFSLFLVFHYFFLLLTFFLIFTLFSILRYQIKITPTITDSFSSISTFTFGDV